MIYFDHNATTPLLPEARAAWLDAVERFVGNPSSPHRLGARADAALQEAREKLAGVLGCDPGDVVWTSGATESNNMVLHHVARTLPPHTEVWVSSLEHPCALEAAVFHFRSRVHRIPATRAGTIDLDWLTRQLAHRQPGLVAVMAANNETGVVQPWREARALCRQWNVPFCCDAAQWIGKLPAQGMGDCDFVSGSAHKFGGPRGVGFLKCPSGRRVTPLFLGGSQEDGRRAGTENVAGVLAMVAALEVRERMLADRAHERRLAWRETFETALGRALPGTQILGAGSERLWNTVSALMPEADCQQRWVVKLDRFGCAVSTGSACASGKEEPSHVLLAMGYRPDEAGRMLRFSSGWETTEGEWTTLLDGLRQAHSSLTACEGSGSVA